MTHRRPEGPWVSAQVAAASRAEGRQPPSEMCRVDEGEPTSWAQRCVGAAGSPGAAAARTQASRPQSSQPCTGVVASPSEQEAQTSPGPDGQPLLGLGADWGCPTSPMVPSRVRAFALCCVVSSALLRMECAPQPLCLPKGGHERDRLEMANPVSATNMCMPLSDKEKVGLLGLDVPKVSQNIFCW